MAAFFVCYRRHDVPDMVGRLHDRLLARFGAGSVVRDVDSVPLGVDFRQHLKAALDRCDALIVVIGPHFLERSNPAAPDYVFEEIAGAFDRSLGIFPVLVRDAEMPSAQVLPESIRQLAFLQGARLRGDPDFSTDAQKLLDRLGQHAPDVGSAETPMVLLVSGPHKGTRFAITKERTLIGRSPNCDIPLDAISASSYHTAIVTTVAGLFCEDLGSTNGTFVNGISAVGRVRLQHGDLIQIGNQVLEVRMRAGAEDSSSSSPLGVTVHLARFNSSAVPCCFINVTNLCNDDVELTHVWMDSTPPTFPKAPDRPLPKRLRPKESWETWIPVADLPAGLATESLYRLGRARLSTGVVIPSVRNESVPSWGSVPGGPILSPP